MIWVPSLTIFDKETETQPICLWIDQCDIEVGQPDDVPQLSVYEFQEIIYLHAEMHGLSDPVNRL